MMEAIEQQHTTSQHDSNVERKQNSIKNAIETVNNIENSTTPASFETDANADIVNADVKVVEINENATDTAATIVAHVNEKPTLNNCNDKTPTVETTVDIVDDLLENTQNETKAKEHDISSHNSVNDEDALLQSDVEDETTTQSNAETSITQEREDELLKSDDDENVVSNATPTQETAESVTHANDIITTTTSATQENCNDNNKDDKDVVTISDEESLQSIAAEQANAVEHNAAEATETTVSAETAATNSNEIIDLADDSQDDVKTTLARAEIKNDADAVIVINEDNEQNNSKARKNAKRDDEHHRLLYKFEIDDSSRESDYQEPRDDVDEEESNDTFASINDDSRQQAAQLHEANDGEKETVAELTVANNLVLLANITTDSIKQALKSSPMRTATPTVEQPKLNGDHKLSQENEHSNETAAVIDANDEKTQCAEVASNDAYVPSDDESMLEIAEQPEKLAREQKQKPAPMSLEADDASRCSSLVSTASSSATTSSSQQLVIDHPLEDLDAAAKSALKNSAKVVEDKVAPLKLTLKRKLSNSSDNAEHVKQQKQPHLDLSVESTEANITKEEAKVVQASLLKETVEQLEHEATLPAQLALNSLAVESAEIHEEQQAKVSQVTTRSLLMQQLERPREAPTTTDTLLPPSLSKAAPLAATTTVPAMTAPAATIVGATKYLCFKCKTGSFDSFGELTVHQSTCLANMSLLPVMERTQVAPAAAPLLAPPMKTVTETLTVDKVAHVAQQPAATKRYYKCSSCNTYHENWNLFLHIREQHDRHMCLYCIRFFPTAEKLSLHLEIKHDLEQNHFNSEEALRQSILPSSVSSVVSEQRFLMCCTCQHVFLEHEPFSDHICSEYMKPCTLCGQKGRHTNQCKAHPDAKRTSKVKKKSKDKSAAFNAASHAAQRKQHMPQPNATATTTTANTSTHCDNNRNASTVAFTQQQQQKQQQPTALLHNEDSNSSSNMVIDETCNNTTYSSSSVNPFKELDERERLEQQASRQSTLSGVPAERITTVATAADYQQTQTLIVPKLKLRVPKEFQKSVYAELSSTESEEEEDDEDEAEADADNTNNTKDTYTLATTSTTTTTTTAAHLKHRTHLFDAVDNNSATESATEVVPTQEDGEHSRTNMTLDDDDSVDERNSNLERILQEIERTKMDIQRTKETFHAPKPVTPTASSAAAATLPPNAAPEQPKLSQPNRNAGANSENWSPTPPTSPNSRWYTPQRALVQNAHAPHKLMVDENPEQEAAQQQPEQQQQPVLERRGTIGSDAMDIDETITGQPTQNIPPETEPRLLEDSSAEKLETSTGSTSTTIDVVNITLNSQTDVMDVDESFSQTQTQTTNEAVDGNVVNAATDGVAADEETKPKALDNDYVPIEMKAEQENTNDSINMEEENSPAKSPAPPADGIEVANEDTLSVELQLDRPLEKFDTIEFVRICLTAVFPLCLYCNHARRIAVNGKSLVLHMIAQHRFTATVDSITAEELKSDTIVAKLKSFLPALENEYLNSTSYCTVGDGAYTQHLNERIFECFQCRFVTTTHKELYLHNRKMHLKTAILCFMCRANFFSFSEILCHICPGAPNRTPVFDVKFRCCLCDMHQIPSPFRLMVHLRKKHFACDVCLEDCRDQSRLSSHVWKHKLHHLCYRCGIAYRNKMDITKHLFWKHGTESIICKRCLQKRWRHVYHFCVPPQTFTCDVCNLCFSKAMYLMVHKRIHTGDLRYPCVEEHCEEKFISRRLLLKHMTDEHRIAALPAADKMDADVQDSEEKAGKQQLEQKDDTEKSLIAVKTEPIGDDDNLEATAPTEQTIKKEEATTEAETSDAKATAKAEDAEKAIIPVKEETNATAKGAEKPSETLRKKKKKNKRSKESLEDLNLTAPNLSESDSSDDSDAESKSKDEDESLVPRVMLSPPSEAENDKDEEEKRTVGSEDAGTGKVLEIWKNFLQAQQGNNGSQLEEQPTQMEADYDESNYPTPHVLHVVFSDHDYCAMFRPPTPPEEVTQKTPKSSPVKRKSGKSPRRTRRASDASSSSSDSSSSSNSSCSCGSNCSCSSSNSSSSSSSSDDSDSSAASNASRKRHRKKSERDRMRKKSESASPTKKKHTISETINVVDDDNTATADNAAVMRAPSPPKEPLFYESDLETAESETDEEFYDEHPQKLASELLAQKRAQLMAQTLLSPSHNYDIVENSRPSTPSLPEDVAYEKRVKLKKKKRDRKSTCKSALTTAANNASMTNAVEQQQQQHTNAATQHALTTSAVDLLPPYDLMQASPGIAEPPVAQQPHNAFAHATLLPGSNDLQLQHQQHMQHQHQQQQQQQQLTPRPIMPFQPGRVSEGSSCSDADGSLKRSKRARRPNKFYGYTSDDENMSAGQPVIMGIRAIKPQPPPQLTWRKEDLPTPSKSILNNKNKTPRTPRTPITPGIGNVGGNLNNSSSGHSSTMQKKKRSADKTQMSSSRKRSLKATLQSKMPRIPTLKIRPTKMPFNAGANTNAGGGGTNHIPDLLVYASSKEGTEDDDEEEDDDSSDSSTDEEATTVAAQMQADAAAMPPTQRADLWMNTSANATTPAAQAMLPAAPPPLPLPPTPQTTVFNHKIPPALLPNPDFATLQYFKANNIRYPIRPPAGARQPRDGESVYCYCRCPYDEVSEMIACDGDNCLIEWFHFECVGIMVAPQGKWFCAECRPKYSEELYPTGTTQQ